MKYKVDFVTNSSSTCFFFLFRNGRQGLFNALANHAEEFNLAHDHWDDTNVEINVGHVVRAIEPLLDSKRISIQPIEAFIAELRRHIDHHKRWLKESEQKDNYSLGDLYQEMLDQTSMQLSRSISAAKSGMTHALVVGFGDNDGDVSGRGVGTVMDYEGRDLDIDDHDLLIMTEQNR